MTVINTNTAATLTANALTKNERAMSQTMERLSTGSRINSASDDAAGLAISSKMTSQINGLNMAVRNGKRWYLNGPDCRRGAGRDNRYAATHARAYGSGSFRH